MTDKSDNGWHLDKRIPIAFLVGILMQTLVFAYWVGGLSERVANIEKWVDSRPAFIPENTGARLIRSEEALVSVKETLRELRGIMLRLDERLRVKEIEDANN